MLAGLEKQYGNAKNGALSEEITFRPHFDTLTRSGQWEYYKSEGVDVIPCAFADLIDNSLQATVGKKNREITVEIHLNGTESFIFLGDNGKGMSKKELSEYPVYRLGKERKIIREQGSSENRAPRYCQTMQANGHAPRYLTSQIGYFGVGGKQAAFRLGKDITVTTRSASSDSPNNVGCVSLSEDEFERLDAAGEDPYRTTVHWRMPGQAGEEFPYSAFLESEKQYETFTRVFISQLQTDTMAYLNDNFENLASTLADIYHFYLHGPNGLNRRGESVEHEKAKTPRATPVSRGRGRGRNANIRAQQLIENHSGNRDYELQITLRLFVGETKRAELNLGDVETNFQSKCQLSEADRFNFVIEIPEQIERTHSSTGFNGAQTTVEGFIRYHPFHLTTETLPFREDLMKQLEKEQKEAQQLASTASDDSSPSTPSAKSGKHSTPATAVAPGRFLSTPQATNTFYLSVNTDNSPLNDQNEQADAQQPVDPVLSSQNALLSQKPIFDLFWNGRSVPNSHVPFSLWKWTDRGRRSQLAHEVFHRLTGCLFFDSNFGVTQNKLTFIDTSALKREDMVSIRPVVDGKVKNTPIGDEFFNWLRNCSAKYDKFGVFFRRERGPVVRPELKGNVKKQWVVFKGIRMGDLELMEGSTIRFRTTHQRFLFGKIRRFFVCADSVPDDKQEVVGFGGEVELELQPEWIRAACASLHPPPPGYAVVPVGSIDFKTQHTKVIQELEALEKKMPAGLKVVYSGHQSAESFTNGIPATRVRVVDMQGNLVSGRLSGNLCSSGHKILPNDLLSLKMTMTLMKSVFKPNRNSRNQGQQWEERHKAEISYSEKDGCYKFEAVPINDNGQFKISFALQSCLTDINDQLAAKAKHTETFRIRPQCATSFNIELDDDEALYRLGEKIPFKLNFCDDKGKPARPPAKFTVIAEVAKCSSGELSVDCPEIHAVMPVDCDDTFKKLEMSRIVGNLSDDGESVNEYKTTAVDVKFSMPDFCKKTHAKSIQVTPGLIASTDVSRSEIDVENHSSEKLTVKFKDQWNNLTYQSDLKIVVPQFDNAKSKTFTVKKNSCMVLIPTPVVHADPYSSIPVNIEIQAGEKMFSHTVNVHVLPCKRPSGIQLKLIEKGSAIQHLVSSAKANNNLKISAGEELSPSFSILDEAGEELPSKDIATDIYKTASISWLPRNMTLKVDDLRKQKLPPVTAPLTGREPIPHHISFKDNVNVLRCDFSISIIPLEPVALSFLGLPSSLPVGATVANIQLALVDVHGNTVPFKQSDLAKVSTNPAAKMALNKAAGTISLSNLALSQCTVAGEKLQMEAKFGSFSPAQASILLVAGLPSKLLCVQPSPATLQLVAGQKKSDVSFEFNLVDEHSNICTVDCQQVRLSSSAPGVHFTPELRPRKMKEGVVTFGPFAIVAKSSALAQLTAQVTLPSGVSLVEKVAVVTSPDPNEPVHVQLGESIPVFAIAGQQLGNVPIHVLNFQRSALKASLPSSSITSTMMTFVPHKIVQPPASCIGVNESQVTRDSHSFKALEQSSPGVFNVHDVVFPSVVGEWLVKLQCMQMTSQESNIKITIKPAEAAQLVLAPSRDCLHASNGSNAQSRVLIPNTARLELADCYGNICSDRIANLSIEIRVLPPPGEHPMPRIDGSQASGRKIVKLDQKGRIQQILLSENTPCTEGVKYSLEIKATSLPAVPALVQYFSVDNDFERVQARSALEMERTKLRNDITRLNSSVRELELSQQQIETQSIQLRAEQDAALQAAIEQLNNPDLANMTDEMLDSYLRNMQDNIDNHLNRPHRTCKCRPMDPEEGVLGKTAQLAQVESDDLARVISWFLAGRMDAAVAMSVDKLREVYNRYRGQQQVVAVDMLPKSKAPWNDVMPHEKIRNRGNPHLEGNPIYARHCLYIPADGKETAVKRLFQSILGDTVIVDTMNDAINYRKYLIDHMGSAPSILTRNDASKIDTLGFAGGKGNRAPSLADLQFVFGAPPSRAIAQLRSCIETVERFKHARARASQHESETAADAVTNKKKLQDINSQRRVRNDRLREVERELNSRIQMPAVARKRGSQEPVDSMAPVPTRRLR